MQRPLEAAGVGLVVLIVLPLVAQISGSWTFGLLAALGLVASLRAYFLPCTYQLDADGARSRGVLQGDRALAWPTVQRVVRERHGVHLSTVLSPSRFVRDRGLFLRTRGNRDAVVSFARQRVAQA